MNSLRGITRKLDAMLLMIIAGLILALALSWNYYQSRKTTSVENENIAASLLAHGLPAEAAALLEQNISRQPLSERSQKLRKSLVDIYMNDLGNYEKALAELVYLKNTAGNQSVASGSEEKIRYCLSRLGRVYDAERLRLFAAGENPVVNNVASDTVVRFGNRHMIGIDALRGRLNATKTANGQLSRADIDGAISAMTQELLLTRAAERENIKNDPEYLARVKQFENSLAISSYLNKHVLKDRKLDEQQRQQALADEINRLAKAEAMQINREVISAAFPEIASATSQNPSGE